MAAAQRQGLEGGSPEAWIVGEDCRPLHAIEYQGSGHFKGAHATAARDAVKKEALRRAGIGYVEVVPGDLLTTDDETLVGNAPNGRYESYQAIRLIHRATLASEAEPRLAEADGTVDAVAWVSRDDIAAGKVEVHRSVTAALAAEQRH